MTLIIKVGLRLHNPNRASIPGHTSVTAPVSGFLQDDPLGRGHYYVRRTVLKGPRVILSTVKNMSM